MASSPQIRVQVLLQRQGVNRTRQDLQEERPGDLPRSGGLASCFCSNMARRFLTADMATVSGRCLATRYSAKLSVEAVREVGGATASSFGDMVGEGSAAQSAQGYEEGLGAGEVPASTRMPSRWRLVQFAEEPGKQERAVEGGRDARRLPKAREGSWVGGQGLGAGGQKIGGGGVGVGAASEADSRSAVGISTWILVWRGGIRGGRRVTAQVLCEMHDSSRCRETVLRVAVDVDGRGVAVLLRRRRRWRWYYVCLCVFRCLSQSLSLSVLVSLSEVTSR